MTGDKLALRIQCIYAAIGEVEETNLHKLSPKVVSNGNRIGFYQDWSGDLNDAQRINYIESLINNIASFEYYLNKWADNNNLDKTKVKDAFNSSQALIIVHELWDNAKHAGSSRNSKSGLYPIIKNIQSSLQLTTKPERGSFSGITFNRQGAPKIIGDGNAKVIITGDILYRDGNRIGDLHETLLKAINDRGKVLTEYGVNI